jgi:hypothetical protein
MPESNGGRTPSRIRQQRSYSSHFRLRILWRSWVSRMKATYCLTLTVVSSTFQDRVSCLKFRIVQDKVIRSSSIPRELWTRPLKLDRSGAIGRWSEQTIKDVGYRDTSEIFLKLEPKSNPDDQGIYFFSITLEQACTLPPSNPEIAKFDFHLEASTIGRHLICDWIRRLWSWPIVSERIDNERTLDSEVAKLVLQYR